METEIKKQTGEVTNNQVNTGSGFKHKIPKTGIGNPAPGSPRADFSSNPVPKHLLVIFKLT